MTRPTLADALGCELFAASIAYQSRTLAFAWRLGVVMRMWGRR